MNGEVGGGKLRKNQKRTGEKQPLLNGFIKLDKGYPAGTVLWIAAWKNEDKTTGEVFYGLKLTEPQDRRDNGPPNYPSPPPAQHYGTDMYGRPLPQQQPPAWTPPNSGVQGASPQNQPSQWPGPNPPQRNPMDEDIPW